MPYDATKMADWQISEAAEKKMPSPEQWQQKLGLQKEEMLPMGRLAKLDFLKIIERLKGPGFTLAFTAKGRLNPLLETIPVRVILNEKIALLGAGRCAAR